MKFRSLALGAALQALVGTTSAQEMFIEADTDGCCTFAPYVWTEVLPGGTWQATVDLTQCSGTEFGWYRYYGYIARNTRSDPLKSKDGIVLTIRNLGTGAVYTANAPRKTDEYILMQVDQPGMFLLTAENTGRSTAKIRLTWTREAR